MWLKLSDNCQESPEMFAASKHLGKRGRARAFCVYIACVSWSNRHLTDGEVPDEAIESFTIDEYPAEVARVLARPDVGLLHRFDGGYRIHDYNDIYPNADEYKAKLKKDRERKRQERDERARRDRERDRGDVRGGIPVDVQTDSERNPEGRPRGLRTESHALARARSRSRSGSDLKDHKITALPRGTYPPRPPTDKPRVLKALVWAETLAASHDPAEDYTLSNVTERLKLLAARAGLAYDVPEFHDYIEAAFARFDPQRQRRSA